MNKIIPGQFYGTKNYMLDSHIYIGAEDGLKVYPVTSFGAVKMNGLGISLFDELSNENVINWMYTKKEQFEQVIAKSKLSNSTLNYYRQKYFVEQMLSSLDSCTIFNNLDAVKLNLEEPSQIFQIYIGPQHKSQLYGIISDKIIGANTAREAALTCYTELTNPKESIKTELRSLPFATEEMVDWIRSQPHYEFLFDQ